MTFPWLLDTQFLSQILHLEMLELPSHPQPCTHDFVPKQLLYQLAPALHDSCSFSRFFAFHNLSLTHAPVPSVLSCPLARISFLPFSGCILLLCHLLPVRSRLALLWVLSYLLLPPHLHSPHSTLSCRICKLLYLPYRMINSSPLWAGLANLRSSHSALQLICTQKYVWDDQTVDK